MKYIVFNYSVYAGKTEIARAYVDSPHDEIRVLQGVPREDVIKKIIEDCPEYAKKNNLTEDYFPKLFSKPKNLIKEAHSMIARAKGESYSPTAQEIEDIIKSN